ncbi:hypothetical protein SDC9_82460 [bioreactor metagenome]|uniref:Uncharacterized protein n=1 Tax=bioreactor metagenome TaxID=1076179 RepID=A0A644Z4S3_9ZZZZ
MEERELGGVPGLGPVGCDLRVVARDRRDRQPRRARSRHGRRDRTVERDRAAVRGPQRHGPHPVHGQRPGLVRADHARRAERLDGRDALHQRALAGQDPDPHGKGEGDGGQESLRDVGHQQPDRELQRVGQRQPGQQRPDGDEGHPHGDRHEGDHPRHAGHLSLQRTALVPGALRQGRDPAQLRVHPGGEDDRRRVTCRTAGPAEDHVGGLQQSFPQ